MQNKQTGLLVVFEGIDGSGKSSLATSSTQELKKLGHEVVLTKEPGGTDFGKNLRSILQQRSHEISPKAEFLLFAADRAQHVAQLVLPALNSGKIVISDRMSDSALAYQGYGRGLDKEMIKSVNSWAMGDLEPDLIFYLKIDYKTAFARTIRRNEQLTDFEKEKSEFFDKVIHGFDKIFEEKNKLKNNVIILDATKTQEELLQEVVKVIDLKLSTTETGLSGVPLNARPDGI